MTPTEGVQLPESAGEITALAWREMQVVAARLLGELAPAEAAPVIIDGTVTGVR